MIEEPLAPKIDRATSTIARSRRPKLSSAGSTPAATIACRRSSAIGRDHVVGGQVQDGLQLERGQTWMLAENEGGDGRDARGGEAVAGRADRAAPHPGHLDV